jgi:hypothetical protein
VRSVPYCSIPATRSGCRLRHRLSPGLYPFGGCQLRRLPDAWPRPAHGDEHRVDRWPAGRSPRRELGARRPWPLCPRVASVLRPLLRETTLGAERPVGSGSRGTRPRVCPRDRPQEPESALFQVLSGRSFARPASRPSSTSGTTASRLADVERPRCRPTCAFFVSRSRVTHTCAGHPVPSRTRTPSASSRAGSASSPVVFA